MAGEDYKQQQSDASAPGGVATALAGFDGIGREVSSTGFDGSSSHTVYDPATGQPKRQWEDNNNDGFYQPGSDDETVTVFVSGSQSNSREKGDKFQFGGWAASGAAARHRRQEGPADENETYPLF